MSLVRFGGTMVAFMLTVAACSGATGGQGSQTPASATTPVAAIPSLAPSATGSPTMPVSGAPSSPKATDASSSPAGPSAAITVEAVDSAFNVKTIKAPANSTFTVTLNNNGEIPHDIAFYDRQGGAPFSKSAVSPIIQGGQTTTITFTTPGPGTYFFLCLVHPTEMTGTFVVE